MDLFGMGPLEILIILIVGLLVFGPERLVDVARTLGRLSRRISQASREFTRTLEREVDLLETSKQVDKAPARPQPAAPAPGPPGPTREAAEAVQQPTASETKEGQHQPPEPAQPR